MGSASDHSEKQERPPGYTFNEVHVDTAAQLAAGSDEPLDPDVAARIRRKIDFRLMPLMCISPEFGPPTISCWEMDEVCLHSARLYDHLTTDLVHPSINIFIWAIALLAHAACKSFGGLFAVRFILGACEGAITPGFMIVTSMFYTRQEQTRRVGYWFLMNGFAVIFLGFLAFGVLHTKVGPLFLSSRFSKLNSTCQFPISDTRLHAMEMTADRLSHRLMIITGIITLVIAVLFWFWFPDSPTTASFLTPEERILAVKRIQVNQTGVENKHWKREQFIETLKDPKVWVMALFSMVSNLINSLINQRQLIVNQFGFTVIQTTLIGCVDGVVEIITIWLGVVLATTKPVGRGYAGILMFIPALLGCLLVNLLPSHMKIGLLFSYWLSIFGIAPSPIFLGWVSTLTSGHTKRITTNAIVLISYAIGNIAGPFVWKEQYKPRNHVPWTLLAVSVGVSALLLWALRAMLAMENKRRDSENRDETYDNVYITHINADGTTEEKKVDKAFLDLTDIQNRDFRYVL
ncbi:hypothetical protein VNI00_012435 [Paramarasmius palmivorus]|uniref:Uncharacterized protein n=1 Tax=Paramarasmius palmivorus TaxID=297713 RepID=A0AAW0C5X5_9AGAR